MTYKSTMKQTSKGLFNIDINRLLFETYVTGNQFCGLSMKLV